MLIKPRDPHPLGRPADPCGGLSSYPDLPVCFRRIVTTLEVQRRGNVGPSRAFPAARACMGWADEIERASRCSLISLWVWAGRKERRSLLDTPKVDWACGGVMDHDQGPSTSHDSHVARCDCWSNQSGAGPRSDHRSVCISISLSLPATRDVLH